MKRLFKYISVLVVSAVVATSCANYLEVDKYFNDRMTLENVFSSQDYTEQWLADAYSHLKCRQLLDVCGKYGNHHNFADDMLHGDKNDNYADIAAGRYENWHTGGIAIGESGGEAWTEAYNAIRKATIMIQNLHMLKADHHVNDEQIADYEGQARFLRAYMYFLILRRYGPVPIIGEGIIDYEADYEDVALPRNTFDECVDFIASEMVKAAHLLPLRRSTSDAVRPTRGAALATRAKALIFGASPWNNPKPGVGDDWTFTDLTDDTGRLLMAQEYDEEKWAKAAAAAKDVMDLQIYDLYWAPKREIAQSGDNRYMYPKTAKTPDTVKEAKKFANQNWPDGWKNIDPFESYRSVFNGQLSIADNPEIIFTRGRDNKNLYGYGGEAIWHALVEHQLPTYIGGWNVHAMTLKQFDAYYMADGTDAPGKGKEYDGKEADSRPRLTGFTTKEGEKEMIQANVHLMNANREPRFYASVAYNGAIWGGLNMTSNENQHLRNYQCFYYRGKNDGYMNGKLWNRTGIGIMKFVHPNDSKSGGCVEKTETAIRYAEVLLWYAEAVNEVEEGEYEIPTWDGESSHYIARTREDLELGIHPVRIRAGLPDYEDEVYDDPAKFRAKLQRERQIELFAEAARWYDLRRWKIAPVELNKPVYGLSVMFTEGQRESFHIPAELTQYATLFTNKMYFWPISKTELKRNHRLTQNPGWQTYD